MGFGLAGKVRVLGHGEMEHLGMDKWRLELMPKENLGQWSIGIWVRGKWRLKVKANLDLLA